MEKFKAQMSGDAKRQEGQELMDSLQAIAKPEGDVSDSELKSASDLQKQFDGLNAAGTGTG